MAEAIDEGDVDHLCEELGDLLLQVVFQARLAQGRMGISISQTWSMPSRRSS
ncbi:MAG: hypothetical protein MZU97_27220 [Bacillus subtilis]|nr:hypothetical protein [Bacillus subtilis]